MRQVTDVAAGRHRHALIGAVVLGVAHQRGDETSGGSTGAEQFTLFVRMPGGQRLRLWFRQVTEFARIAATAALPGTEVKLMTDDSAPRAGYAFVDVAGNPLVSFRSGAWSWHPFDEEDVFAFMLSEAQRAAVRSMMEAVVRRDENAVAGMLAADLAPISASPGDFWMWADDYGHDERLVLVMPPGEVADWDVSGFPSRRVPGALYLHAEVWAASGLTDLTIRFELVPDGGGYRIELEDMHVM